MRNKLFAKASAAVMAAAMMLNGSVAAMNTVVAADANKYEFEDADIKGDITVESDASASGGSNASQKQRATQQKRRKYFFHVQSPLSLNGNVLP